MSDDTDDDNAWAEETIRRVANAMGAVTCQCGKPVIPATECENPFCPTRT